MSLLKIMRFIKRILALTLIFIITALAFSCNAETEDDDESNDQIAIIKHLELMEQLEKSQQESEQ